MFSSRGRLHLALLMKMFSDGFPTSKEKPIPFHQLSTRFLCNLASDFVALGGGVWGLMGTFKGQEGFSKEREVQEGALGYKTRFLGGNSVQAPPWTEQDMFDPLVTLCLLSLTSLQALLQTCPPHLPSSCHHAPPRCSWTTPTRQLMAAPTSPHRLSHTCASTPRGAVIIWESKSLINALRMVGIKISP